jgi:hypothetical protein
MATRGARGSTTAGPANQRSSARPTVKGSVVKTISTSSPSAKPLKVPIEVVEEPLGLIDPEPAVYIARRQLKMRLRAELESDEVGFMPADSRLKVIDRRQLADGSRRARISLESDELIPKGWISVIAKDGSDSIKSDDYVSPEASAEEEEEEEEEMIIPEEGEMATFSQPLTVVTERSDEPGSGQGDVPNTTDSPSAGTDSVPVQEQSIGKQQATEKVHKLEQFYDGLIRKEEEKIGSHHKTLKVRLGEQLLRTQAKVKVKPYSTQEQSGYRQNPPFLLLPRMTNACFLCAPLERRSLLDNGREVAMEPSTRWTSASMYAQ